MWDNQEWVTQLGVFEDRNTPQKSMLERAPEVLSDAGSCPISTMVEQLIRLVRNTFFPELDKLLDSNGNIPTGKQAPQLKELLRLAYYDIVQAKKAKIKTQTLKTPKSRKTLETQDTKS